MSSGLFSDGYPARQSQLLPSRCPGPPAAAAHCLQARWDSLGLSRKQKFAVLGLALLLLWVRCSWSTRMVAVLVGALAVRCHLKPAEVSEGQLGLEWGQEAGAQGLCQASRSRHAVVDADLQA